MEVKNQRPENQADGINLCMILFTSKAWYYLPENMMWISV